VRKAIRKPTSVVFTLKLVDECFKKIVKGIFEKKKTLPYYQSISLLTHGIKQEVPIKFERMKKTTSRSLGLLLFAGQDRAGGFPGDDVAPSFSGYKLL
jgi:hypothetical protein